MSDFTTDLPSVTVEDMDAFLADNPDLRLLAPINGTQPSPPEFASGQTGVPPVGGVEGDESQPPSPETPPEPETGEPEPQPEPAEGEPEAPEAQPAEPTEPPPSPDDFYEFDGDRYPRSQIEAAARFQKQLTSDPQLQNLIKLYLAGEQGVSAQPAIPAGEGSAPAGTPSEIDLDDPSIRALYDLVQSQVNQITELRSGLSYYADLQAQQQRAQINGLWEQATTSFAKEHNLEANDIETLGAVAARLGVIPQLMSGLDPVTGSPSSPDPIRAFDRALEIAMLMVPEYRDREFRRSVQTQQQESQKRKLLGSVGGSSGSVARTQPPPRPGSPEARRAMLAEVGAMLNGSWDDPSTN